MMNSFLKSESEEVHVVSDVWNNMIVGLMPTKKGVAVIMGKDYEEYEQMVANFLGDISAIELVTNLKEFHGDLFEG